MTSVVNLPAAGRAPGPGQTVNAAPRQARALLDEALDMSLAIPSPAT
jgi:hypothetical protein